MHLSKLQFTSPSHYFDFTSSFTFRGDMIKFVFVIPFSLTKVIMQGKLITVALHSAYILKPVLSGRNL